MAGPNLTFRHEPMPTEKLGGLRSRMLDRLARCKSDLPTRVFDAILAASGGYATVDMTAAELAEGAGCKVSEIRGALDDLAQCGVVESVFDPQGPVGRRIILVLIWHERGFGVLEQMAMRPDLLEGSPYVRSVRQAMDDQAEREEEEALEAGILRYDDHLGRLQRETAMRRGVPAPDCALAF
jgi:hypothetical protein